MSYPPLPQQEGPYPPVGPQAPYPNASGPQHYPHPGNQAPYPDPIVPQPYGQYPAPQGAPVITQQPGSNGMYLLAAYM